MPALYLTASNSIWMIRSLKHPSSKLGNSYSIRKPEGNEYIRLYFAKLFLDVGSSAGGEDYDQDAEKSEASL